MPRRFALRQVVFCVGMLLLFASAAGYAWIQGPLKETIALQRHLGRNVGRILTLDEILTMSARMAAAAHDRAYEARYNEHVDELDALIKATLALVPDQQAVLSVTSTNAANHRLVELEAQSFALDHAERWGEALALLEGDAYRADKASYADGMRAAFARMEEVSAVHRTAEVRWSLALQLTAVLALALVVGVWLFEQRARRRRAAAYAGQLEATVAARTAELAQRNRGMRLVLDNVAQGFVTIDLAGAIAPERSAIVDRWFGAPADGATLAGYLAAHAPAFAQWLELGLGELREGVLPGELLVAQLPRRFSARGRTFDVAYSPIAHGDAIESLLVILSDATADLVRERVEREQKDLVSLFQRISIDRTGVEEFLTEAAGMVGALERETDAVIQKRLVHTLKGNCAIYGLESYAEFAHAIENELAQSLEPMTLEQREGLVALWKEAMARVAPLLGCRRDVLEIEPGELDAAQAQAQRAPRELADLLASWRREPVARRFERLARQVASLSRRLRRPEPTVRITGDNLRLDRATWRAFWAAMIHAARNVVDHGIESPEERRLAGKPEAGVVELSARRDGGRIVLAVRDDGRGIDWERVRARAGERGVPCADHAELCRALFVDGLTTRDAASELSGRGVGLSALRHAIDELGGAIDVESAPGAGTTFRFSFDEARMIGPAAGPAATTPRPHRTSLLPFLS